MKKTGFLAYAASLAAAVASVFGHKVETHPLGTSDWQWRSRGLPSFRYGNTPNSRKPHQGRQECVRRAIGGWGFTRRLTGLGKRETMALAATKSGRKTLIEIRDRMMAPLA